MDVDVLCLLSESEDETEKLLREHDVTICMDDQPGRKITEILGHYWGNADTYRYMADLRNRLLDYAEDYDYFLSLDSDIVLPPNALRRMIRCADKYGGVVSPAVNMVPNGTIWNNMHWVNRDRPSLAHRPLPNPPAGKADVIMAVMLLDKTAISKCQWVEHPQGEDVGFCLDAHGQNVKRWWLPNIRCEHMMRARA